MLRISPSGAGIGFVLVSGLLLVQFAMPLAAQVSSNRVPEVISRVTRVKGLKLVSMSSLLPPIDAFCRASLGVEPLLQEGYDGAGETIIIIDSFGSPTMASDLATFDAGYGLPDPPSFTVLSPLGTVSFDPSDSDQVGWATETTLDVEWAHAMAPGAAIVLLTSPISETEGVQGLPQFLELERYALGHRLGKVVSQSWAATENTLFDPAAGK